MNDKSVTGTNQSGHMYSYQEEQKVPEVIETGAIRRSLGDINPNAIPNNQYNQDNQYNQIINNIGSNNNINNNLVRNTKSDKSPHFERLFFIFFGILQIVFIIFIAIYYHYSKDILDIDLKGIKPFQEINIFIFIGFGFLRSFIKYYSWTSIALTFIAGIVSFEFGLFIIICWSSLFKKNWSDGIFNFQHLLDTNYCSATVIIALGAVLGKLSFPQYFIMIFLGIFFSTLNYVLLRQTFRIIDVGGALTVHLFGASFGAMFSFISLKTVSGREKNIIKNSKKLGGDYNSNIFALFGSLILLTYWPSFNTSLLINNRDELLKNKGIINTFFALLGSIIGTFCISPLCNQGKIKIKDILNSSFSGGIVVAGCCHIINDFWPTILLGALCGGITTFLCNLLSDMFHEWGYHDTSEIFFYHGIPGFLGGIITAIFVGISKDLKEKERDEIDPYIGSLLNYTSIENYTINYVNSTNYIMTPKYAGFHFIAIVITIGIALASGIIAGFTIKFCNCKTAERYFTDSEFFYISDTEAFHLDEEQDSMNIN
jgi:ammonium transporter Rh